MSSVFSHPDRAVQHVLRGHFKAAEQSGNQSLQRGRLRQQQEQRDAQKETTEQEQVKSAALLGCSASELLSLQVFTACVCVFRPMEVSAKRPAPFLRQVVAVRKPVSEKCCR